MRRTILGLAWISLAMACDEAGDARGVGPGPGKPRLVEEGNYGPIAQYLVDNAVDPAPGPEGTEGGEPGDGGGGTGGEPPAPGCDGFACNDGACIVADWRCDDITDCAGGEDEQDCAADPGTPDAPSCQGFTCNDGACIDATWQCDDYVDCTGGEDEQGCAPGTGGGGDDGAGCDGFTCDDGGCIDATWQCDGYSDCAGGEDEANCAAAAVQLGLAAAPDTQAGEAIDCIAQWTVGGAGAGVVAGELVSKGCEAGGVVVGLATAGGGFAAATVCLGADVTQIDAVVGGIFGAVSGLVGGIATCEGNALAEAGSALMSLVTGGASVPTYQVEASANADAKQCGIPLEVPLSGDEAECSALHDEMKEFDSTKPHSCNVDIGNVGNDAASIAAACDEIRTAFDNAATLADKRLAIGEQCYDNGKVGPMGSSDFGHQFAWCSVHQAMQRCLTQAQHPKLACDLSQTMSQHFLPSGCENVLACQ